MTPVTFLKSSCCLTVGSSVMKFYDFYFILKRFADRKIFSVEHLYHGLIIKASSYSRGVELTPSIFAN